MKNYYRYLFILISLFLIGCSSTYTLKDFPSKEKFYEDFNKSAKDKTVNITLINDSSFTSPFGAVIQKDTLFIFSKLQKSDINSLSLGIVKEVKYKNRWLGTIPGLLGGLGSGIIIGIPISVVELVNHHDKGDYENIWALYISAATGTTIGIMAGWLIGNDYIYQFNP